MRGDRTYYVYIMANEQRTIYIGVTNSLERRVWEHRHPTEPERSFAARYRLTKLVYVEEYDSPGDAIAREKRLKGWKRSRKPELIGAEYPEWRDLAVDWYAPASSVCDDSVRP